MGGDGVTVERRNVLKSASAVVIAGLFGYGAYRYSNQPAVAAQQGQYSVTKDQLELGGDTGKITILGLNNTVSSNYDGFFVNWDGFDSVSDLTATLSVANNDTGADPVDVTETVDISGQGGSGDTVVKIPSADRDGGTYPAGDTYLFDTTNSSFFSDFVASESDLGNVDLAPADLQPGSNSSSKTTTLRVTLFVRVDGQNDGSSASATFQDSDTFDLIVSELGPRIDNVDAESEPFGDAT